MENFFINVLATILRPFFFAFYYFVKAASILFFYLLLATLCMLATMDGES